MFLVVAGNEATDDHTPVEVHAAHDGVHDIATDVFKIDVDAVGSCRSELFLPVGLFVVDGGVEAEILRNPGAFLVGAGNADNATAVNLADLADDAPGGARGSGDDKGLAFLGLSDFHAEKRGQAVHAEYAEEGGSRHEGNLGDLWVPALLRTCG